MQTSISYLLKTVCCVILFLFLCKGRERKLFIHTAGSCLLMCFKGWFCTMGYVLYKHFQNSERLISTEIPCFIEGNSNEFTINALMGLCNSIWTMWVFYSEDRKYLSFICSFACNFVNHCYSIAADILDKHHIPFDVLLPTN